MPGLFPLPDTSCDLHITQPEASPDGGHLSLERLALESVESDEQDSLRLTLLQATLRLLTQYIQLYASQPALVEVFEPLLALVEQAQTVAWHGDVKVGTEGKMDNHE